MTTKTMQTDSNLEVPQSEVQPLRMTMGLELLKAARSGDKGILDKLLQPKNVSSETLGDEIAIMMPEDAAIQKDINCLLGVTLEGNTALHMVASRGHLECAEEICQKEISLLAAQNTRLDTPLHCAARAGDGEMVSLFIQFARKDEMEARRVLRARNWDDATALHEAAKFDHVHVAEILMEEDAGLASMLNNITMSPLYLAIMTGSLKVAKALLHSTSWKNNASPASYAGPNKKTALHAAVHMNSRDIARELLRLEPTLAKGVDSSGRIPLHFVASDGDPDTVKLLLEHDPSTAYLSDADGSFPIHIAAMWGNIRVVDEILKQCPDTDELLDKKGKNFLHVAFKRRRLNVVRKIISKRRDLRKLLNEQDNEGNTPLHTAVINNDQGSVFLLLRNKTVCINVMNHDGFTPLDLAYANVGKGLHFVMNAADCIAGCLASTGAIFSQQKLRHVKRVESSSAEAKKKPSGDNRIKQKSLHNEAKEIEKELSLSRTLGIASVLIATVTFAAGFTLPGGYIADDHPGRGTAVLAKKYAFRVFLLSDVSAFICSIVATCWLTHAGTLIVDRNTRIRALDWAVTHIWVAFAGMSAAFAMGVYVALPPGCRSVGILSCVITLAAPILTQTVAYGNVYSLLRTVRIRQGWRQCIWPTVHPHAAKRLRGRLRHCGRIAHFLLSMLGFYAIFFLVAMI